MVSYRPQSANGPRTRAAAEPHPGLAGSAHVREGRGQAGAGPEMGGRAPPSPLRPM